MHVVSLNHPRFLLTRSQKRIRCRVCYRTCYVSFILWSLHFQGSPVARVKADPDSSGLPGLVSTSLFFNPIITNQNSQIVARLSGHHLTLKNSFKTSSLVHCLFSRTIVEFFTRVFAWRLCSYAILFFLLAKSRSATSWKW